MKLSEDQIQWIEVEYSIETAKLAAKIIAERGAKEGLTMMDAVSLAEAELAELFSQHAVMIATQIVRKD